MIKLRVTLAVPDATLEKYKKDITRIMVEENIEATRKWLKTVLRRTPTYTGTARGTYAPLGRVVRHNVRKGKIKGDASRAAKKKYFIYKGQTYPLGFKEGEQYQEHRLFKRISKNDIRAYFEFDQQLLYVLWNEEKPGPSWFIFRTPPPWLAMEKGEISYNNHFRRHTFKRLHAVKLVIGNKVVKSR